MTTAVELRAKKLGAMANKVFGDQDKAISWFHNYRKRFDDQSTRMLMRMDASHLTRLLGQLTLRQAYSEYISLIV